MFPINRVLYATTLVLPVSHRTENMQQSKQTFQTKFALKFHLIVKGTLFMTCQGFHCVVLYHPV